MKKLYPLLMFFLASVLSINSQVVQLNQSFTATFNPSSNGWMIQNNSTPLGWGTWAQGFVGGPFPANSGAASDYFAVGYDSQGTTTGTISNFFITPTVNIVNGGVLKFATRTYLNPSPNPDRLEVRMSIGTGTGAIGSGVNDVGTFTNVLITINPSLTTSDYPGTWTFYTATLTGISTGTVGRFAFRYDVPDSGINGWNGFYIGLDDVTYTASCGPSPIVVTPSQINICQGGFANLSGSGASSYTWTHNGSNSSAVSVTPVATTVYTVSTTLFPGCVTSSQATVAVTVPPNLSVPDVTVCAGISSTVSASGATSYSWSNGQTGSVITVPGTSATYTVTGTNPPNCSVSQTVSVFATPYLVSASGVTTCVGITPTLTATGATTYSWSTGQTGSVITVPSADATYTVTGFTGPGCTDTKTLAVLISSLQITAPSVTTCAGITPTLSANGAASYSWSTGQTGAAITVPSISATYTVTGTSGPSCTDTKTLSVLVATFVLSAPSITVCPSSNPVLTASGASTYSWSTGGTGTSIAVPSTPANYTVTGMYGPGCSDTKTLSVFSNTFLFVSANELTVCPGVVTIIGAAGANTYAWNTGPTTASIAVTPSVTTKYTVVGSDGTCNQAKDIILVIELNLFTPNFTTCAGTAATLIATGAQSYSWSTGATSSVIVVPVPSVQDTVYTYSIKGITGACSQVNTVSVTAGTKLSVNRFETCVGATAILTAYGANSYTWYPIMDFNPVAIVVPTAATVYTLVGSSGTCTGSQTISVSYCAGVEDISGTRLTPNVFPNPFRDEIKMTDAYGSIRLINMAGALIYTSSVDGSITIPTETLEPGLYFIMLNNTANTERKVFRIIKN